MSDLENIFQKALDLSKEGLGKFYPACAVGIGDFYSSYEKYFECSDNSFFDVASITKPIVGSNLVLKLGLLNDKVAEFLPEPKFDYDWKMNIKVADILKHTAGFVAHFPLFELVENMEPSYQTRRIIMNEAWNLRLEEQNRVVYSDIGFIVLTYYIENKTKKRVDELFYSYMNFRDMFYLKDITDKSKIVPTSYTTRVHDENSYYMMGISLHAGLFSNVAGLAEAIRYIIRSFKEAFLEQGIKEIQEGERFFLGFDSFVYNGKILFGHLGFTGCGFWIDFENETYAIFLSNRVFPSTGRSPSQAPEGFMKIRKRIWQLLCE